MAVDKHVKVERATFGTVIVACEGTCKPHKFQDAAYGGRRVHNRTKAGGRRCTVCGHVVKPSVAK